MPAAMRPNNAPGAASRQCSGHAYIRKRNGQRQNTRCVTGDNVHEQSMRVHQYVCMLPSHLSLYERGVVSNVMLRQKRYTAATCFHEVQPKRRSGWRQAAVCAPSPSITVPAHQQRTLRACHPRSARRTSIRARWFQEAKAQQQRIERHVQM